MGRFPALLQLEMILERVVKPYRCHQTPPFILAGIGKGLSSIFFQKTRQVPKVSFRGKRHVRKTQLLFEIV